MSLKRPSNDLLCHPQLLLLLGRVGRPFINEILALCVQPSQGTVWCTYCRPGRHIVSVAGGKEQGPGASPRSDLATLGPHQLHWLHAWGLLDSWKGNLVLDWETFHTGSGYVLGQPLGTSVLILHCTGTGRLVVMIWLYVGLEGICSWDWK